MNEIIKKLKLLKDTLDWNMNLRSMDILPSVISIIKEAEAQLETPVVIEPQKEIIKTKELKQVKEPAEEITTEKDIKELRVEYKKKYNKNPFGWWSKEVLIEKLK